MNPDANEFITVHSVTLSKIELVTVDMQMTVIYTSGSSEQNLFCLMSQRLMENHQQHRPNMDPGSLSLLTGRNSDLAFTAFTS